MALPYGVGMLGIAGAIELRDIVAILGVEGDDACRVAHAQEFHPGGADEGVAEVGFVVAVGFADEEDWGGHSTSPFNHFSTSVA
jgi:hypothetical protein